MSPILPGIVASGISGHLFTPEGSAYEIAQYTVPSGGLAQVTFAVPAGYRHLEILTSAKSARTDASYSFCNARINGDTGSNYSVHEAFVDPRPYSTVGGYASQTSFEVSALPTSYSGLSNMFSVGKMSILDYASTTKYKTISSLFGYDTNNIGTSSITGFSGLLSAAWHSTQPVTSITLYDTSSGFTAGSTFTLIGYK